MPFIPSFGSGDRNVTLCVHMTAETKTTLTMILSFLHFYFHMKIFSVFLLFSSSVRDLLAGSTINRILFRSFFAWKIRKLDEISMGNDDE